MQKAQNEYADIWMEDGILVGIYHVQEITLSVAKSILELRLNFAEGEDYPLLVDARKVKTITREAREFFASDEGMKGIKAGAIIIDSALGSFVSNFFLRINKPTITVKLFTNREQAKDWLQSYTKS